MSQRATNIFGAAFVMGMAVFLLLQTIAARMDVRRPGAARTALILKLVALFELFFLPAAAFVAIRVAGI